MNLRTRDLGLTHSPEKPRGGKARVWEQTQGQKPVGEARSGVCVSGIATQRTLTFLGISEHLHMHFPTGSSQPPREFMFTI